MQYHEDRMVQEQELEYANSQVMLTGSPDLCTDAVPDQITYRCAGTMRRDEHWSWHAGDDACGWRGKQSALRCGCCPSCGRGVVG